MIITGGDNGLNRVEQYNLAGSMGRLPDLKTGRYLHGCGYYVHSGKVVSTNTIDRYAHINIFTPSVDIYCRVFDYELVSILVL